MTDQQEPLFDLDELTREAVRATPWTGAPLAYVTDYYSPNELEEAFQRYQAQHGSFASVPNSHMWHEAITHKPMSLGAHQLHMLSADARCEVAEHDHSAAPLPGGLMYQAICAPCRWHAIESSENGAVEAWHDHAVPGWRALPILPRKLTGALSAQDRRSGEALAAWITKHYPADWQRPGAPIRTHRQPYGTRHVPDRSPLGGYDMAAENA